MLTGHAGGRVQDTAQACPLQEGRRRAFKQVQGPGKGKQQTRELPAGTYSVVTWERPVLLKTPTPIDFIGCPLKSIVPAVQVCQVDPPPQSWGPSMVSFPFASLYHVQLPQRTWHQDVSRGLNISDFRRGAATPSQAADCNHLRDNVLSP